VTPNASAIEALAEAWWQRCQARRCASGRADADERELLLHALGAAAGDLSRLFEQVVPPSGDPESPKVVSGTISPDATSPQGTPLPLDAITPAAPIERRRTLAAAATRWGARVGSPVLVVEQLVQLRTLVAIETGQRAITRLIDLTMINACRGATDELQRAAFSDPLTGCANRRAFERDLDRELARCARAELDLSVVAIDLDGLKAVNDTAGHAAGDRQLVLLVDTLRKALRSMDGIYRLGGDEFGLVLPDTSPDDAAVLIARAVRLGAPPFSWGTAGYSSTGYGAVAELLAVADADLYARRRVMRSSPARRQRRVKPEDASLRLFSEEEGAPRQALRAR
jgi:diguanylate cyclase (GGDEF)-like protein